MVGLFLPFMGSGGMPPFEFRSSQVTSLQPGQYMTAGMHLGNAIHLTLINAHLVLGLGSVMEFL